MSLPDTKRQGDGRRADLKGLDLDSYAPFQQPNGTAPAGTLEQVSGTLRQRGTSKPRVQLDPVLARLGVVFLPLAQAAREHRDLVERYLFSAVKPDRDKFAALHAALFTGGSFLYVPDGVSVEHPLISQVWSAGSGRAVLPPCLGGHRKAAQLKY